MKKLLLLFVMILSVSVVFAQADTKAKSGCNKKKCASYGNCAKAGAKTTEAADADVHDTAHTLCPAVAAGGKCEHPENCPYSHDTAEGTAAKCTCDQTKKKGFFKFWGKSEKCDYCKSKNK